MPSLETHILNLIIPYFEKMWYNVSKIFTKKDLYEKKQRAQRKDAKCNESIN